MDSHDLCWTCLPIWRGNDCSDSSNIYPAAGGGIQYILKPKEGIVMNLEYAHGKSGNYGVYLKLGYAY